MKTDVKFRERNGYMQCRVVLPDGRMLFSKAPLNTTELGFSLKKIGKKIGKVSKNVVKANAAIYGVPVKSNVPILNKLSKMQESVKKTVAKKVPITRAPFKALSAAGKVLSAAEKKKRLTKEAIKSEVKKLPKTQQKTAAKALVKMSNAQDKVANAAKVVALAKVAAKLKSEPKQIAKAGFFVVTRPDGRVVNVPVAKVR